jgi:PPE-repeat protein
MVLDFAALPPEVNSALMYTGAGSGPLMAAGTAWSNLAAELSTTATQHESIITTLTTEQWTGAGSAAAAAAAQPYIAWLTTTAAAAEQAASQAMAAAAAYEAAFAATVPPPAIAANRAQLAALVATNFLGINTPAILATEAQYVEMWVQDAITMYTYAASAAASSVLQPLQPASPTTSPGAAGTQAAAVSTAVASAQTNSAATGLGGFLSSLPAQLSNFGSQSFGTDIWSAFSAAFPGPAEVLNQADGLFGTLLNFNFVQQVGVTAAWFVGNTIPTAVSYIHTVAAAAPAAAAAVPAAAASDVAGAAAGAESLAGATMPAGLGGAMTAGLGGASAVGGLSVPASWSSAAPATLASSTAPLDGSGWTAATDEAAGGPVTGMMPGMAAAAKGAGAYGAGPRYGFKPIVMPKQVVV